MATVTQTCDICNAQVTSFEANKAPKSRPPRNDNERQKGNGTFEETKEPGMLYSLSLHKPP